MANDTCRSIYHYHRLTKYKFTIFKRVSVAYDTVRDKEDFSSLSLSRLFRTSDYRYHSL